MQQARNFPTAYGLSLFTVLTHCLGLGHWLFPNWPKPRQRSRLISPRISPTSIRLFLTPLGPTSHGTLVHGIISGSRRNVPPDTSWSFTRGCSPGPSVAPRHSHLVTPCNPAGHHFFVCRLVFLFWPPSISSRGHSGPSSSSLPFSGGASVAHTSPA